MSDKTELQRNASATECLSSPQGELERLVKCFSMEHILGGLTFFTEETAPDWLTSKNTIRGSTMDNRWFWNDEVLCLQVGESIETDFHTITRTT